LGVKIPQGEPKRKEQIMIYTTEIENVDECVEIEVEYDYEPFEPMTRNYPGWPESATIYKVTIVGTDVEIELLPKVQQEMEDEILNWMEQERIDIEMDRQDYLYQSRMERRMGW
jgi:AAA15 family ATPase/GTPase